MRSAASMELHNEGSRCSASPNDRICLGDSSNDTPVNGDCIKGDMDTEQDKTDPIAVIGFSLKFPQDAVCPESFWQMLMDRRSAMTEIPKDRFNADAFCHPTLNRPGVLNGRGGHFITEDLAAFDASFFTISPEEAACMDPQQRWLLEMAYLALENSGIPIEKAGGSKTSVHIGSFMHDYDVLLSRDPELKGKYRSTGTGAAMLANRLSWFFNFTGPSLTVDTACSSSLVALHLACQSLRGGESIMGLVGGCNLFFNPDTMATLNDLNFLSPDSKCYSFDHRANGYARGEGFGVIVIKMLSKALADGDTIRAVIRATGSNQDGHTPGITQPNSKSQETLIQEVYASARLDLALTRYFEAHGTGTAIGDPLEASAIHATFRNENSQPLYIGAVKTNIGHLEGASGIAGIIKTILTLEKGIIAPNIWFEQPNPRIPVDEWNIKFPTQSITWPTDGLRRASVNSFGFGGSNAHAVLDDAYNYLRAHNLCGQHWTRELPPSSQDLSSKISQAPVSVTRANENGDEDDSRERQPKLLVWSAADEDGLSRLASAYRKHLRHLSLQDDYSHLRDLAYTLSERRSKLIWRSYVIATGQDLPQAVESGFAKPIRSIREPKLGFIFTGQGAQWARMGRELAVYPVFKRVLEDADVFLQELGCLWSLIEELDKGGEASNLDNPGYSQPICTVLQTAIVDLLSSWGVTPSVVVGHSSGEIAAAYCAGGLTQKSAWRVAYYRGIVSTSLTTSSAEPLGMLSVGLSEAEVDPYLEEAQAADGRRTVSVACINSTQNVTLAGTVQLLDRIKAKFEKDGIFTKTLRVNVAYHSQYMHEAASVYHGMISDLQGRPSEENAAAMVSSVTGHKASRDELQSSAYWTRNMISPVRFCDAVSAICLQSSKKLTKRTEGLDHQVLINDLVEIGPHSALRGAIKDILRTAARGHDISYNTVLIRGQSSLHTALKTAGQLYCRGYSIDVAKVNHTEDDRRVRMLTNLPSYPFNHTKRYWLESRLSRDFRFRRLPRHDLLGAPTTDFNRLEARWRNIITISDHPWIKDHKVNGLDVYPAAGMLVMAIEAAYQLADRSKEVVGYRLRDTEFQKALIIPSQTQGVETIFTIQPPQDTSSKFPAWSEFRLCAFQDEDWAECFHGSIAIEYAEHPSEVGVDKHRADDRQRFREIYDNGTKKCKSTAGSKQLYTFLQDLGLGYGPSFQALKDVRFNRNGEATAAIDLWHWTSHVPENKNLPHTIHPAALDGILQVMFPALTKGGKEVIPTLVPVRAGEIWISETPRTQSDDAVVATYANAMFRGYRTASSTVVAVDTLTGKLYMAADFQVKAVAGLETQSAAQASWKRLWYNIAWKPDLDLLDNNGIKLYCSDSVLNCPHALTTMLEMKERLCYLSIIKVLGEPLPGKALAKPHLRSYIAWMTRQASIYDTNSLILGQPDSEGPGNAALEFEQLCNDVEKIDPEGKLIVRVARSLSDIFKGGQDGLDLLFRDSLIQEYYRTAHNVGSLFSQTTKYIDALAHKNPGLRILEIGAGTGGATDYIIESLLHHGEYEEGAPRFAEYVFTDISPAFLDNARNRFNARTDRMTFATLDIEKDPIAQGYELGKYDLLIAANVLHATTSIDATLRNVRKLIKHGGKLILYETTNPRILRIPFIFGLLPGWWLSTEESRRWSPLLTEKGWQVHLCRNEFSGIDVALHVHEDEQYKVGSALISTVPPIIKELELPCRTVILLSGTSSLQSAVAHEIQMHMRATMSSSCQILRLGEVTSENVSEAVCIFLPELDYPFLHHITPKNYDILQTLISSSKRLLWAMRCNSTFEANPLTSMVTGLSRSIRSEHDNFKFTTVTLQGDQEAPSIAANLIKVHQHEILASLNDVEGDYTQIDGRLCVGRLVEANYLNDHVFSKTSLQRVEFQKIGQDPKRPLRLSIGSPGLLDTLGYVDDTQSLQPLLSDEIEVKIQASGLNFRDVVVALGQLDHDSLGLDCAGVITRVGDQVNLKPGDRVSCLLEGSFRMLGRCKALTAVKIPDAMPFHIAAAFPVIYCTAYHALINWAHLKAGESILIHSAAGGLGQATIQLAKLLSAEIYVTVGSEDKKKLLMDVYSIPEDHIFFSRTLSFISGIRMMTNGRGVDVIVNSLAGESLRSSWECIAPFGRFIETGKRDISSLGQLPMKPFATNVMFASVDLAYIFYNNKTLAGELMNAVLALFIDGKISAPEPLEVMNGTQLEEMFRLMQSGKNIGKMVLKLQEDDMIPIIPNKIASYSFDPNASYLLSGGLGGLGKSIAQWMTGRGVKNLILLSRSGQQTGVTRVFLDDLETQGVKVATPPCDISDEQALKAVLQECSKTMPPIKGCIQASMVLKDAMFHSMALEDFNAALKPKVDGSWNLHTLLPKKMDFFILLSSFTGICGNHGQANYASGNTYQDALAQFRISRAEKAVSLDLGAVLDAGFVGQRQDLLDSVVSRGGSSLRETELHATLDYYCNPSLPIVSVLKGQAVHGFELPAVLRAQHTDEPPSMHRPLFRQLYQIDSAEGTSTQQPEAIFDFVALIQGAESVDEAGEIVCDALMTKLSKAVGVVKQDVDVSKPMHAYGVDSLVALEIQSWFSKVIRADVPVFEILSNTSIAFIAMLAVGKSQLLQASLNKTAG